jgi:hypothetical protein
MDIVAVPVQRITESVIVAINWGISTPVSGERSSGRIKKVNAIFRGCTNSSENKSDEFHKGKLEVAQENNSNDHHKYSN